MRFLPFVLALCALAPVALADHVFSHRVYVSGRAVDAEGLPAAGTAVLANFTGIPQASGRCFDSKPEVTGPLGDFELCRHVHIVPRNPGVTVSVGGGSATAAIDPLLRNVFVQLQLPGGRMARDIQGDRDFNATFRVAGIVWEILPANETVENVPVAGAPRAGADVLVQLLSATGEEMARGNGSADEHGRWTIDLEVGPVGEGWTVKASSGGQDATVGASPLYRRADLLVVHDVEGPVGERPGSAPTPMGAAWLLSALALAALASRRR